LREGRVDFPVLLYTVTNFHRARQSHAISRGISAPHVDTVALMRDG